MREFQVMCARKREFEVVCARKRKYCADARSARVRPGPRVAESARVRLGLRVAGSAKGSLRMRHRRCCEACVPARGGRSRAFSKWFHSPVRAASQRE